MDKPKRFDIFFDRHIGFGIRWDDWQYPVHLSIAFPFFTMTIGFGNYKLKDWERPDYQSIKVE